MNEMNENLNNLAKMVQALSTKVNDIESSSSQESLEKLIQRITDSIVYHEAKDYDASLATKMPKKLSTTTYQISKLLTTRDTISRHFGPPCLLKVLANTVTDDVLTLP